MGFMQAEMTEKQIWVCIDGPEGTEHIPGDLVDVPAIREILDGEEDDEYANKILAMCRDYCENREAFTAELVNGYGVRSTAPGYLDCTSWSVYTNKREAIAAYNAERRECEGENPDNEM